MILLIIDCNSLLVAYINDKLVFETSHSDLKELSISKGQWILLTFKMERSIDNCSNQINEYTFDLYINNTLANKDIIELDDEFLGFNELDID
ncbi:MAG: hypothetical protein MR270_07845, partial [Erysipelotrichaceae bacterium]|nr:hypothetical protein [Erysipelotrichaceae bacterium]